MRHIKRKSEKNGCKMGIKIRGSLKFGQKLTKINCIEKEEEIKNAGD